MSSFFLLALLINELNDQNASIIPQLLRRQVDSLLNHLFHCEGFVLRRFFKQYLISQKLNHPSDLMELKSNLEMIIEMLLNRRIPDVMAECLSLKEISSADIFQGLYYLGNQQMLDATMVIGTHFELQKIKEISLKLGQYVFVLLAQKINFSNQKIQEVMKANARAIEAALVEYDKRITNIFQWVSRQVIMRLKQNDQQTSNQSSTYIPHSSTLSNRENPIDISRAESQRQLSMVDLKKTQSESRRHNDY